MTRFSAILAAGALCLLAACGSDDDEKGSGSAGSAAAEVQKIEAKFTEAGKKSTIDFPKSMKAGQVELSIDNTGKKPHDLQLVRVAGDQTIKDVLKVVNSEGAPTPKWLSAAGGVGTVGPDRTGSTTAVLAPGKYFALDTEEGGGNAEFEVTGEASAAELPATSARIETVEYGFKTSGLKAGKNTITFDNTGSELHHVIAAPINKGATFADVKKFAMSEEEPSGPPPIDFEKTTSTAVIDGGAKQVTEIELQKGKYAFLCFISDRKGGPPHVAKGMVQEVEIK